MASENMEINLEALTAKVVLPETLIAEKMAFVEPYAIKLSPRHAAVLRQNSILYLRLVYLIKNIPDDAPAVQRVTKEVLLLSAISKSTFTNTQLTSVNGSTAEEKLENYKKSERGLFDVDSDEWWKHRVREIYDLFAFADKAVRDGASRKTTSGCLLSLLLFLIPTVTLAAVIARRMFTG